MRGMMALPRSWPSPAQLTCGAICGIMDLPVKRRLRVRPALPICLVATRVCAPRPSVATSANPGASLSPCRVRLLSKQNAGASTGRRTWECLVCNGVSETPPPTPPIRMVTLVAPQIGTRAELAHRCYLPQMESLGASRSGRTSSPRVRESGRWSYLDPTGHGKGYGLRGLAAEIGIVEAEGIQRECGGKAVARFRYGPRSR